MNNLIFYSLSYFFINNSLTHIIRLPNNWVIQIIVIKLRHKI